MSDGQGCKCGAYGACECGCVDVDWTSSNEIEYKKLITDFITILDGDNDIMVKLESGDLSGGSNGRVIEIVERMGEIAVSSQDCSNKSMENG